MRQFTKRHILLIALILLIGTGALPPRRGAATRFPSLAPQVFFTPDGAQITWKGALQQDEHAAPDFSGWQPLELTGYRLPAQLVTLRLTSDAAKPSVTVVESVPWAGSVPTVDPPLPRTLDGEPRAGLQPPITRSLPTSPLVVVREGRMRGIRIAVFAISPLYETQGQIRAALHIEALIPGARALDLETAPLSADEGPFLQAAQGPTNPLANTNAIKVIASTSGMQRITGAALAEAGVDLSTLDPTHLRLWKDGSEVALEERIGGDGAFDPDDEIRFFAPSPGDRWNPFDIYWLEIAETSGMRMAVRFVEPFSAPRRQTALERATWRNNVDYDSLMPGPDGDHWFALVLRAGAGLPPATTAITPNETLPLVPGASNITVEGSALTPGKHTLTVTLAAESGSFTWNGIGSWRSSVSVPANSSAISLTLAARPAPAMVRIDSLTYERPVQLDFNGRGAQFVGVSDRWRYQLKDLPAERTLYDISNHAIPEILPIGSGPTTSFEDGPAPHSYLLAGPGTLHEPQVVAHAPVDLAQPLDAQVLWIAPREFHDALEPLAQRRQAQGYSTAIIDVHDIYDSWSYGLLSPTAIRDFLRYAASSWNTPPVAVTLVGDGTFDPRNYLRKNNRTLIPPYLAMVDPWLGETACDQCYAQLDGIHPVESPDSDALPDLALGRLPVKSVAELESLVRKLISYETAPLGLIWQSRSLYVADNYRDEQNITDPAGDFAAMAENSIALQPEGLSIARLYYDPSPSNDGSPWREADALKAHDRTQQLLSDGYALVNYYGHSNHWQWAVTDLAVEHSHLLQLYEADSLSNHDRPSILLAMTCLTSAFHLPAVSGTTIDERLLLHGDGGAIAVWGSTGLGVAHGHDLLQHGFYEALWQAPPQTASLGSLTLAGYLKLFSEGGCCQDALRTFVLLGDPLTPARVLAAERVFLPNLQR